jgi:hypothetical protein
MAVASRDVASADAATPLERLAHSTRVSSAFGFLTAIALFAYVLWFRTHDITQSFGLAGDQLRDWQVALRAFSELPLTGVSSTAGGNTIGPAYYWILWGIARVIGPFTGYLPHAGGIGISALQSLADALLFLALSARLQSWLAALLIVLIVATSGYDATLSSTIWNPPVAVAFVKMALAALLWERTRTWRTTVAAIAASWIAVHCHTTGILVAAPASRSPRETSAWPDSAQRLHWRSSASFRSRGSSRRCGIHRDRAVRLPAAWPPSSGLRWRRCAPERARC